MPSRSDKGAMIGSNPLATRLGELARELQAIDDPDVVLRHIVEAAIAVIPGAEAGSISELHGHHRVVSRSASNDLAQRVDALMVELGEGPGLDAALEHQTIRVSNLSLEQRWPAFAGRAVALGVRSALSFQLFVQADNLGALNLYATAPGAFTDESEHVGLLFATHAAVAYAENQRYEHLSHAIETRDLIGQAVGILMERYDLDPPRAFAALARLSQQSNRKLREIAADVVSGTVTKSVRGA